MDSLPPIPDQDWRAHQVQLFSESSARMIAPFEEAERARAYRDQQSAQFAVSSQALQQDLGARLAADQVSRFNQGSAPIAEAVAKLTAPPTAPSLPTAKDVVGAVGGAVSRAAGNLVDYARQAAQRAGIDPDLFVRQINQESGFDPKAGSPAGAQGIAQIVPKYHPNVDPWDPHAALDYAANLMKSHLDTYGNYRDALTAYNGGGGAVAQLHAGTPYDETQRYLSSILGGGQGPPTPTGPTTQEAQQPPIRGTPAPETTQAPIGSPAPDQADFQGQVGMFDPSQRYLGRPGIEPVGVRALETPMSPADVVSGLPKGLSDVAGMAGTALEQGAHTVRQGLGTAGLTPEEALYRPVTEEDPTANLAMGIAGGGLEKLGGAAIGKLLGRAAEEAATAPTASAGFRQFWDRARNVIARQGAAGQELAGGLQQWRNLAETTAGDWTARLPTVRRLNEADFRSFVVAAEGQVKPRTPLIAQAVDEWNAVRSEVYRRAKDVGLDIGKIENYWPHVFPEGTFEGKGWTGAIDHLVESGQAESRADAAQMLRYAQDVARNRRYGNLEAERELNLPFYKRTKDVLFGQGGYLEAAANRIAQVQTFGEKDVNALRLIDRIGQQGGDAGAAKKLFDISVGATKYGELQQQASRIARGVNTVASLGLSAITNASQTANTAAVAGFGPTARALWRALRDPAAREDAVRAGVTLENVVQDVREGTGLASRALGMVTAPGFGFVERFNRTFAFHAGIGYAENAAAKAAAGDRGALRALERLGLDGSAVAERGVLTEAEKIAAGRSMVERTQFKVDPQDLPGWASSPWGKVFTQFKTFSYNQSAFMGREIIAPALQGDLRPLARFMVAALAAGAATTETKNLIQGRQPEQDPAKRILQYYQAAGGLGLVGDVLRVTTPLININADRLPEDRIVSQALGTAFGPTFGAGAEILGGLAHARQGFKTPEGEAGRYVPLERSALRRIPVIGTALQNRALPYAPAAAPAGGPVGRSSPAPPRPPKPPSPPKPPKR